jgi:HEPN domain-containing protein
MSAELPSPGSPSDWLRLADSDLALAEAANVKGVLRESLCFHAQQAAEKGLKALLVHHGVTFPYTHDLAQLLTVCAELGIDVPPDLEDVATLTEYAVSARYPGTSEPVDESDYVRAVDLARQVLIWARVQVENS